MSTVLITGGTGLIGTALTRLLTSKGYDVIILSRSKKSGKTQPGISYAQWNVEEGLIDAEAISKADYVIHLAGAGVADKRWTEARKNELVISRTQSSALLLRGLKEIPNHVKTVISSSAIGWYGPDTAESLQCGFTEEMHHDNSFLSETCRLWEASIEPVADLGIRLVKLRTGIVLSKTGGALAEFRKPLAAGVAAILGNGSQVVSWIHIDDLCNLFIYAMEHASLQGTYNAVAPYPVSNKTLTLTLARKVRGRFFIPVYVPSFILKIVLGEMSIEVLKSAKVSAAKIQNAGFVFQYPDIGSALNDLAG
jgi:uncharacterized protein (TIGR01777 family)